jgi:MerR family copper efflux transcriptional regulator
MNISQAAQACGLTGKTIRFYEEIGLVVPERQEANSYRIYSMADIEQLRFLQRARAVGFGIEECRQLLALYLDTAQRSEQVKVLLGEHLHKLDQQFIALNSMRASLQSMIDQCALDQVDVALQSGVGNSLPIMAFTLIDSGRD